MNTDTHRRADALWKRAKVRGLRLSRLGPVFTLYRGETELHRGDVDEVAAYLRANYPRMRPGPPCRLEYAATPEWVPMIDAYLMTLAAAGRPSTTIALRRIQLAVMSREIGGRPADVTGERLVEWLGGHAEWATETRRSNRCCARLFFLWAYQTKRIPVHIADDLPKVREHRGAPRPAPDHVWRTALMAADARTTLMLRLAGEAGLRRGEVARVHSRDLLEGVDGAQLLVNGKGDRKRLVPLSASLAAQIRMGAAGHTPGAATDGWLFPNTTGGHLGVDQVGALVKCVLPDHWTMHALRHRFASRAYRGSRNLRAVQVLLGHSSIATTERYLAVDDSEIRAAMEAAGA